jgi:hypothetical protein
MRHAWIFAWGACLLLAAREADALTCKPGQIKTTFGGLERCVFKKPSVVVNTCASNCFVVEDDAGKRFCIGPGGEGYCCGTSDGFCPPAKVATPALVPKVPPKLPAPQGKCPQSSGCFTVTKSDGKLVCMGPGGEGLCCGGTTGFCP